MHRIWERGYREIGVADVAETECAVRVDQIFEFVVELLVCEVDVERIAPVGKHAWKGEEEDLSAQFCGEGEECGFIVRWTEVVGTHFRKSRYGY